MEHKCNLTEYCTEITVLEIEIILHIVFKMGFETRLLYTVLYTVGFFLNYHWISCNGCTLKKTSYVICDITYNTHFQNTEEFAWKLLAELAEKMKSKNSTWKFQGNYTQEGLLLKKRKKKKKGEKRQLEVLEFVHIFWDYISVILTKVCLWSSCILRTLMLLAISCSGDLLAKLL